MSAIPPQTLFSQRWLAETFRLRDGNAVGPQDAEAIAFATSESAEPEQIILLRAQYLGNQDGTLSALRSWRQQARWILIILLVLALIAGFSSARAVLGDGNRPVNVIWALGGLLGVNWLMLLLWLLNLVPGVASGERGGLPGRFWLWLSGSFGQRSSPGRTSNASRPTSIFISQAFADMLNRSRSTLWCFGAVTHILWLCLLSGALLGLLLSLALRSYVFIWETTILPADVFVDMVSALGWLPAQLGMAMPDAEMVRGSGVAGTLGAAINEQQEPVRRAWSGWLAASLLLYGIGPRLLLMIWCLQMLASRTRRLQLDTLPAYASLLARIRPASEAAGVSDTEPDALYRSMIGSGTPGTRAAAVLGLEIGDDYVWPKFNGSAGASGILLIQPVENREQRRNALTLLEDDPPARLLIVCDPRLSPDRGTLNWIADASWHAGETRVLLPQSLLPPAPLTPNHRLESWRNALQQTGLQAQQIYVEQDPALRWVQHET